jgi:hypothetical protein
MTVNFRRNWPGSSGAHRILLGAALVLSGWVGGGVATGDDPPTPEERPPSPLSIELPAATTRERRPLFFVRVAPPANPDLVDLELTPDPKTLVVLLDGTDVTSLLAESGAGKWKGRPSSGSELVIGFHRLDARMKNRSGNEWVTTRSFFVLRPAVEKLDPPEALPGSTVVISGGGFDVGSPPRVLFAGAAAQLLEFDDQRIAAVVPKDAISGGVAVELGDVVTAPFPFRLIRASGFRDISGFALGAEGKLWVVDAGAAVERSLLGVVPGEESRPRPAGGLPNPRGPVVVPEAGVCAVEASPIGEGNGSVVCFAGEGLAGVPRGSAGCLGCEPRDPVAAIGAGYSPVDPGAIYVIDGRAGEIRRVDPEGTRVWARGLPSMAEKVGKDPSRWRGQIVFEPREDHRQVAFVAMADRVLRVVDAGGTTVVEDFAPGFGRAVSLALDDRGGLIVADEGRGEVVRVDLAVPSRRSVLAAGLDQPRGVAFRRIGERPELLVAEATRGIGLAAPTVDIAGVDPDVPLELKGTIRGEGPPPPDGKETTPPGIELVFRVRPSKFVPSGGGQLSKVAWTFRVVDVPASPENAGFDPEKMPVTPAEVWREAPGFPLEREGRGATAPISEGVSRVRFVPPSALPSGSSLVISARIEAPPYDLLSAESPLLPVFQPPR